jgi:site-specific DNA-methyltransferase (adenine-specific)
MTVEIIHGDCRAALEFMPSDSIHSVVTDPPYALVSITKRFGKPGSKPAKDVYARGAAGFMGKTWDTGETAFDPAFWADVWRVLRPGGHVLAFGGTRTYHRLASAIEDAGFEIRDQIGWVYGSGFPKSHNMDGEWEGWGTALKPAWEPIVVARKALDGTNAENLARWGVGALNIDGCRVGTGGGTSKAAPVPTSKTVNAFGNGLNGGGVKSIDAGRWPANVIHDGSDEVIEAFPNSDGSGPARTLKRSGGTRDGDWGMNAKEGDEAPLRDAGRGSAARFFYCAKASRADRHDNVPLKPDGKPGNDHPTVKPTELMRYLCRLVTPPGGTVLDPFMGSGSTGRGAVLEGFNFIGCEMEAEYAAIARARIAAVERVGVFA